MVRNLMRCVRRYSFSSSLVVKVVPKRSMQTLSGEFPFEIINVLLVNPPMARSSNAAPNSIKGRSTIWLPIMINLIANQQHEHHHLNGLLLTRTFLFDKTQFDPTRCAQYCC